MNFPFPGRDYDVPATTGPSATDTPSDRFREFLWTDSLGVERTHFADRLMFTAAHVLFAIEGKKFDKVSLAVHNDNVRSIVEVEG